MMQCKQIKMKKGFIFDLDGVIVDTAKYHYLAWRDLAKSLDIDFTLEQNEQLKGVSRVKSLEKILAWGNKSINYIEFEKLMKKKNKEYLSYIDEMEDNEVLVDVPKVLSFISENKQGIALGSASKNARMILQKVNLLEKFDHIVDGNDVIKGKPNPEVFLKAADLLKIAPENCIVFEDSVAGIQAANTANMLSIGIGEKETLFEADYVFEDFTQISISFLEGIIKNQKKMNQDYIIPNNWSILEEGFHPEKVKSSESLMSIGNGAMGQRANFEEKYTGDTFQGSYIAGVYYPDKTLSLIHI